VDINGGCHCGKVTYEGKVNPENVLICHCTDCQIMSGSAFRTVAPVREANFSVTGDTRTYVKGSDSGNGRAMVFCPECGTQLYGTSVGEGEKVIGVRVGTCNQRAQLKPRRQIWCQSELSWISDVDALPSEKRQ
jgi:hypothetical protein